MNTQEQLKLEKKLLATLKLKIKDHSTIIAAISGGADSIFLLHFLKQITCKIIVAHLNHGLRAQSRTDEIFVKTQSARIPPTLKNTQKNFNNSACKDITVGEIIFQSKKIDLAKIAKKTKKGLEESGRIQRYKFFQDLAKKYKAQYIITAHHADDNLETILLNFTRGATLKGLCGMEEEVFFNGLKNTLPDKVSRLGKGQSEKFTKKSTLLRPLLHLSKKDILTYLKSKKLPYVEDQTNKDLTFTRNFLRHKIIPELKKINPNLTSTISKNTENLREINNYINKEAKKWLKKKSPTKNTIEAKAFKRLDKALQKAIILEKHLELIGHTTNIENIHLDEVLKIIQQNIGNKQKNLGRLKITIKKNIIELKKS